MKKSLAIRFDVLDGHQVLVIFSVRGVNNSYCTPLKFNKVSPPSSVDVHMICLIGETMLYCVFAFYLLWNIFFFSSFRCPNRLVVSFCCAAPVDLVVGTCRIHNTSYITNSYKSNYSSSLRKWTNRINTYASHNTHILDKYLI